MTWRGFRKESISYINPRTIRQWVEFWLEYPSAWLGFVKLMRRDYHRGRLFSKSNKMRFK